jgi:hypothetical protein
MIVRRLCHWRSCSAGARSPTSTSRLVLTRRSRATCSARSTYRLIQYIESASRASIGRDRWFTFDPAGVTGPAASWACWLSMFISKSAECGVSSAE